MHKLIPGFLKTPPPYTNYFLWGLGFLGAAPKNWGLSQPPGAETAPSPRGLGEPPSPTTGESGAGGTPWGLGAAPGGWEQPPGPGGQTPEARGLVAAPGGSPNG